MVLINWGCVVSIDQCEFTQETVDALKTAKRAGGSFAPIIITKHNDSIVEEFGIGSVGLMGF